MDEGYRLKVQQIHKDVSELAMGAVEDSCVDDPYFHEDDRDAVCIVALERYRSPFAASGSSGPLSCPTVGSSGRPLEGFLSTVPSRQREENYRIRYFVWKFDDWWPGPGSQEHHPGVEEPQSDESIAPFEEQEVDDDVPVFPALFRSWKGTQAERNLKVFPLFRTRGVKDWPDRQSLPRLVDSSGRVMDWGQDLPWRLLNTNFPGNYSVLEELENFSETDGGEGDHARGSGGPRGSLLNLAPVNAAR